METNYKIFIDYLDKNEIKYENNEAAKLVRFGYNIEVGSIEIVVDFEHEGRIGFFSFLNMSILEDRKCEALKLLNFYNESLNYGSIIVSQSNQLVYKIMVTTFGNSLTEENWSEVIVRLVSSSRDMYPLFGKLVFSKEDADELFDSFLRSKEKLQHSKKTQEPVLEKHVERVDENVHFWRDFRDWYMQN